MTEQSGCDPQAAVEARLRHLLVENPTVKVDPVLGEAEDYFATGGRVTGVLILDDPNLSPEEYEKLHETWIKLDPRIEVRIEQPMAFIPFGDPGDETDAFSAPCDWCSGDEAKLNEDGTCPACGYDW